MRRAWLAAIPAVALAAGPALGGAWTRPAGETFVSAAASYYRTESDIPYEEATTTLYVEHGFREGLTIGGALEVTEPVGESEPLDGDVTAALFVQRRLWVGDAGDPLSLQLGLRAPLGDVAGGRPPQLGTDDAAAELRLLYGRGFETRFGGAFFDGQAAVRRNFGDDADEIRLDVTVGLRPEPRWLVMAQSFTTLGLENAERRGADFSVTKLAPSIGYEVIPGVTALIGVEREIAGRNVDLGTRLRAAVWTAF